MLSDRLICYIVAGTMLASGCFTPTYTPRSSLTYTKTSVNYVLKPVVRKYGKVHYNVQDPSTPVELIQYIRNLDKIIDQKR